MESDQTSSQVRWVQPGETFLLLPTFLLTDRAVQAAPPPPQTCRAAWSLLSEMEGLQVRLLCTAIGSPSARSSSDPDLIPTSCGEFCWSWLKRLHSQAEECLQHRAAAPHHRCALFSSHLLTTRQHRLHPVCSRNSALLLLLQTPIARQKRKKITARRCKMAGATGSKAVPWPGRVRQPEGGGPRRWALGAQSPAGLQVALRAKAATAGSAAATAGAGDSGRARRAGQGRVVGVHVGGGSACSCPLPAALRAVAAPPQRCHSRPPPPQGHAAGQSHRFPSRARGRAGRARLSPGFAGAQPALTAGPGRFRPAELRLSLPLNQRRAPAALAPPASKSLQGAKRCQKLSPMTPLAKRWLWPPTQRFASWLRSLSDEDTRLLPCSPQGR